MGINSSKVGGYGLDSYSSLHETVLGTCEHYNEPLRTIKCRESLNQV
jgi:hypothetical protein